MWLGEQITERGIGNGISIIIFVGIIAGLPSQSGKLLSKHVKVKFIFLCYCINCYRFCNTAFVVFVERGQRRIVVNYAKRQQGRKVFAAQSTHLTIKVKYGWCNSCNFCLECYLISWYDCAVVWSD